MPGSVASIAGQVLPAAADRAFNFLSTKFFMDYKDKLARQQWERQNQFDSPANQIQRIRAAGLNPDLAYNQMSAGQGITYPETDVVGGSNLAGAAHDAVQSSLQSQQVKSQIALNESLAHKYEAETGEAEEHTSYYRRLIMAQDILDGLRQSNVELNQQKVAESIKMIDKLSSDIAKNQAEKDWIESKTFYQDLENAHFDEKFAAEMGLIKAKTSEAYANAEEARAAAAKLKEETKQLEEITKTIAERCKYELRMLANDADMSDMEKKRMQMDMYKHAFDVLKYKGYVYMDRDGTYHLTDRGGRVTGLNDAITLVGNILGAVGQFYTHHSFYNSTPEPERPEPVRPEPKKYPLSSEEWKADYVNGRYINRKVKKTSYVYK